MADGIIWSTLYLGNLPEMDTDEFSNTVEDASPLLTTFGGGAGNALAQNIVDVTSNAGADTTITSDNSFTTDTLSYDLGSGTVTAQVDAVIALSGTVTFKDGSTFTSTFGVFQTDTGDVFMMVLDSQPELASQWISSVTFTSVVNSDYSGIEQSTKDDWDFICFGPGTLIATPFGPRRADRLRPGDLVTTLDDGPQPIRWIGKRRLRFSGPSPAQPVRIARDALGPGLPRRDTLLSPNHRVLLRTSSTHLLHDPLGALAPAKALTRQRGIRPKSGCRAITYFSFLLPMHAVLIANGIAVESLYPGPEAWAVLSGPERSAWLRLAGRDRVTGVPPARLLLSAAEARAGLEAGAMALPDTPPVALPRHRRGHARPRLLRLAAG